jgi:bifunctional ADP-heptose synthase (sugar kinase/adenylyltransferase)
MEFIYKDDFSLPTRTTFISDEQKIVELTDKKGLKIDEKSEIDFVNRAIRLLNEVDAVIFCDYGNGFLNKGIVNPIIEEARNKGILCTALIDNESFGKVMDYSFLDFVVCSEKEARQAVNNFVDGIDFLSRDFLSKTKYKNLIINLGREGLISYNPIIDPQQISSTYASYLPFLSNQITDISGMKEALISAITLSLASKSGIQHALYLGGAASSIASSKMGNEPVSNEEIVSFIEKQYN